MRMIFYPDDILIVGPSFNICLENTQEALLLLIGAGFIIHEENSCLVPSTDFPVAFTIRETLFWRHLFF
jgi:hypothetical protein